MIEVKSRTRMQYVDACKDKRDYWDVRLEVNGLPLRVEVEYAEAKIDEEILVVLNKRESHLLEAAMEQLRINVRELVPQLFKDVKELKAIVAASK